MRILKTLLPLFAFIVIGSLGSFSQNFIQKTNTLSNWFILPAFIMGVYYTFALTHKQPRNKGGGVALGRIAITIFITMLTFTAIEGYIMFFNCYIGKQTETYVLGTVSYVNYPEPKKVFDRNSIIIVEKEKRTKIVLEVPTDNFYVGQVFTKKMLRGSFGILYSPN